MLHERNKPFTWYQITNSPSAVTAKDAKTSAAGAAAAAAAAAN